METINTLKSIISPFGETTVLDMSNIQYYEGGFASLSIKVMNSPNQLESSCQGFSDAIVTFNAVATLDDEILYIEPDGGQSSLEIDGYKVSDNCKENAAYELDQVWMPFGGSGEIYNYIQNDDKLVKIHDQIIEVIRGLKEQITTH